MNAQEFLAKNRPELESPYEAKFVERVLAHVTGLDFGTVQAQTPFTDTQGRKRRIDFTIEQGEHVRIALEVDGWDKTGRGTGMTREEFDDSSRREVTMCSQGWRVLRFANRLVDRSPKSCARHIALVLKQAQAIELSHREKSELEKLEREKAVALEELEGQLHRTQKEVRGIKTVTVSFTVVIVVIVLGVLGMSQFANRGSTAPPEVFCEQGVDWSRARDHIGETVKIKGPVVSASYQADLRGAPTFLNLGADFPAKGRAVLVVWGKNRKNFPDPPEALYENKTLCVSGEITEYEGVAQIVLRSPGSVLDQRE